MTEPARTDVSGTSTDICQALPSAHTVRTVEISEKLLCLFSAEVAEDGEQYTVRVPRREVESGEIETGATYRVALVERETGEVGGAGDGAASDAEPQPPVEPGETRYVEIEDLGKQGDGIARVERGYVIIVPGAEVGEQVKIEVTEVKSNFAVAETVDEEF